MAKRVNTSTGDELPASTSGAQETINISPESSPQHSPQHSPRRSPQRESATHFPLASAGVCIFTADISGHAGVEWQQGVPTGAVPDAPPPLTTLPGEESSASELYRDDEELASTGTGNPSDQLDAGKPLALESCYSFCVLSS